MNSTQSSPVAFFIIQGLASLGEKKMVLFIIFLLAYTVILGGNIMIIYLVLYIVHAQPEPDHNNIRYI
jgi:hypothetical protein